MQKIKIKLFIALIIITAILLQFIPGLSDVKAEGVGVTLSASSNTVDIGSTITVTVKATSAIPATNYSVTIKYDPAFVSFVDYKDLTNADSRKNPVSSGTLIATAAGGTETTANLAQFSFKALKAGGAVFSIHNVELMDPIIFPPDPAPITVTIRTPLPGNTNLASLSVDQGTLNPKFSAGQQSYSLPVAMGVDSIKVTAEPEDPKAKVSVSGNSGLSDGSNTIRIVVTAQNGSTKTYTINAIRQGPTPTPEPTPTPPVSVMIDGTRFSVTEPPQDMEVPSGFYQTTIEMNGQLVTAFKSLQGDLILLYLSNDGPESGFYFYDAETGDLYDYAVLTLPGAVFTRLTPGEDVEIPAGFSEASLTIDGEKFDCWRPLPENDLSRIDGQNGDIYLLYLMDNKGDRGFFLYQASTRRAFPYSLLPREPEPTPVPTQAPEPTPLPEPEPEPAANPYLIATIILAAVSVVLLGLLVWSLMRKNNGNGPGGPDYPGGPGGRNNGAPGGSGGVDETDKDEDFSDRHRETMPKPPKIRRVD
jgi:hypothetical protein